MSKCAETILQIKYRRLIKIEKIIKMEKITNIKNFFKASFVIKRNDLKNCKIIIIYNVIKN